MENTKIQNFKYLKVRQRNQKLLLIIFFVTLIITVQSPISAHASTIGMSKPGNYLGLVGWWTFDGKDTVWTSSTAATTLDKSGNGNTGTLTNMNVSTAPVPGKVGQGLYVGSNGAILLNSLVSSAKSYTFSVWINNKSVSAASTNLFDSQTGRFLIGYGGCNSRVVSVYSNSLWKCVNNNGTNIQFLGDSAWHLLVFTLDNTTGVAKYYVDALFTGTSTYVGTDLGNKFGIGSRYDNSFGNIVLQMDDVRVYSRVLSSSEIQQLYNMGK